MNREAGLYSSANINATLMEEGAVSRELTKEEIGRFVDKNAQAARNA